MKKLLRLILYPIVLFILFLRFAPLSVVNPIAKVIPEFIINYARPEALPVKIINSFPADTTRLEMPQPKWQNEPEKQRRLVSWFKYEKLQAEKDIVQLSDLYFLRAGKDFLATYHRRNHEILLLSPELKVQKIWPMQLRNGIKIDAPVDIAVKDEDVWAIDRQGLVAHWNLSGVEQGHFMAPVPARDIDVFEHGDILLHGTSTLPWLLARVNSAGVVRQYFAPQIYQDSLEAELMLQGIVAMDRKNERICLAYKSPFTFLIYKTDGTALNAVEVTPNFQVADPIIEREANKVVKAGYQKVIFDAVWHEELLWLLVSSEMGKAPQWLEIFDAKGEFLQRFALLDGVSRFALLRDRLYVLGYAPHYRIEAYDMKLMANDK
ncbi:MAG: hypothetical protein H6696_18840 [Deferribacteres bacterium]|nr:hypothetical protein [candidate division KSB1 bacterium]MCB9503986.1 hypothetical protein [Deferribacteres bacterium]